MRVPFIVSGGLIATFVAGLIALRASDEPVGEAVKPRLPSNMNSADIASLAEIGNSDSSEKKIDSSVGNGGSDQSVRRTPLPRATPRELLARAQQTGSPKDAYLAADSIRSCKRMAGAGQRVRDALISVGLNQTPEKVSPLLTYVDGPERACQELDGTMQAEYEPMLRRAMGGGVRGAAALWWLTPEATSLKTAAAAEEARQLLRRDALECDKRSLMTYQVLAVRFKDDFAADEAAAVRVASTQLEKQGKFKGNSSLQPFLALLSPSQMVQNIVNKKQVSAQAEKILQFCNAD